MLLSDTIVDFHLFYDRAVDIQIWALLTRSQCKVSDTQVTVKARGPLVEKMLTHDGERTTDSARRRTYSNRSPE